MKINVLLADAALIFAPQGLIFHLYILNLRRIAVMNNVSSEKRSFLRSPESEFSLRADFLIALLPVILWSVIRFGIKALVSIAVCALSAAAADVLLHLFSTFKFKAPSLHIIYCGAVLALTFYSETKIPVMIVGGAVCTLLIYLMGGAAKSFVFAPLVSRIFLMGLLPDMINKPTGLPLEALFEGNMPDETLYELILGMENGAIGSASAIAILLGIIYLWIRKAADFNASLVYLIVSFALSFAFPAIVGRGVESAMYELLSGEVLFACAYVVTDYASGPRSYFGRFMKGILCALLTFIFRRFGFAAESVFLSLICTNIVTYVFSSGTYYARR